MKLMFLNFEKIKFNSRWLYLRASSIMGCNRSKEALRKPRKRASNDGNDAEDNSKTVPQYDQNSYHRSKFP